MISYLATEIKMFEEKCHTCVEEIEKATLDTLIVNKLIFVSSNKTCHSQPELRIFVDIVGE